MPRPNYNRSSKTSMIPVNMVMIGSGSRFFRVMEALSRAMPQIFRAMNTLQLSKAYRNVVKVRFVERPEAGGDAFYYDKSRDIISIYPLVPTANGRLDKVLFAAFGRRYFERYLSSAGRTQWSKKLVYPDRAVIDHLQDLFKDSPRSAMKHYLRDFRSATEKLVVIHILNALIANSIKPNRLKTLDLRTLPCTAKFVNGSSPFSMKPLLSAYVGKQWGLDRYEVAFAEYCARSGNFDISEPSVEDAAVSLFQAVTFNR